MNPTTSAALTGVIVAAGHWSKGKKLPIEVIVGIMFVAIFLALMGEANEKFAGQFGLLIVAGSLFVYGTDIFKNLNSGEKRLGKQGKIGGSL